MALSDSTLKQLESRLEELIRQLLRLKSQNRQLVTREHQLVQECADLRKKNELAKAKIEAMITRLRALEQEP